MRTRTWIGAWLAAGLLVGAGLAGAATTNYVAWDAVGASNGTSWADAYTSIQTAIDNSVAGDSVFIKQGTYSISSGISVPAGKGLTVRGGYTGATPEPGAYSGDASLTVVRRTGSSYMSLLTITSAGGWVEGLTFTEGYRNAHGPGVYLSSATTVFTNCVMRDNLGTGQAYGVGAYVTGGSPTFDRCVFKNNVHGTYTSGGGLYVVNASVTARHCVFRGNSAVNHGLGGGLCFTGSGSSTLFNCLVVHNATAVAGAGAGIHSTATLAIENCTVINNPGVGINGGSGTTIENSIVWGHDVDIAGAATNNVTYSDVQDGAIAGPNVIHGDPLLEYGYYIGTGSPCIGAGDATAASLGLGSLYAQASQTDAATVDLGYHQDSGHTLTTTNLYVDAGQASEGDGSAGNPFKTLTNALAQAQVGATIHVAAGTYSAAANGEAFPLGFDTEAVRIIGAGGQSTIIDAAGAAGVMTVADVSDQALLKDLTVRGGSRLTGGGLYLDRTSVELQDCIISDNLAARSGYGAGAYIYGGTPKFSRCTIKNNTAAGDYVRGGGVYGFLSGVRLTSCVIGYNRSSYGGGAAHLAYCAPARFFNCLVVNNAALYAGAAEADGVAVAAGRAELVNCTVVGNAERGIYGGSDVTVSNSIVRGHEYDIAGSATNNVTYSCIEDAAIAGTGVIHGDPLFEFGYYLGSGSPCINAGAVTAASLGLDAKYAQASQLDGGTVDLGYHYAGGHALTVTNLYVDASQASEGDGSEGNPFKTLTNALAQAQIGATIHVAGGTYNTVNGEVFPLVLDETLEAVSLVGTNAETTVIDAAGSAKRVVQIDNTSDQMLIQGLTLRGGADPISTSGGVGAGGLLLQSTRARVEDCVIRDNALTTRSATGGGGVAVVGGRPTLRRCAIHGNNQPAAAQNGAGGVFIVDSPVLLESCIVSNNVGTRDAGGIKGTSPQWWRLVDCLVADNRNDLGYKHAGVRATTVYVRNCTFAGNGGAAEDYALGAGAASAIANSIFWDNQNDLTDAIATAGGQVSYCDIGDGNFVGQYNNIQSDPLFVSGPRGAYYLSQVAAGEGSDSPCLDAGDDTAESAGLDTRTTRTDAFTDDGAVDMGYHYFTALPPGAPYVGISDASVTEGDLGSTTTMVFTVELSWTNNADVTVNYATSNGLAEAPADYVATNGSLTITAGSSSGTIDVTVNGDDDLESNHSFFLRLSGAVNGVVSNAVGEGTIVDDEGGVTVAIADASVSEGDAPGTTSMGFTVVLSDTNASIVTVEYATSNGTAVTGGSFPDYVRTNGTLTFAIGDTNETVTVTVLGDDIWDGGNETFHVLLSNAVNAAVSDSDGLGTIVEDEVSHTYVALDGDGSDGLTWGTAQTNLQEAVNGASAGDILYVKQGTYALTNALSISGKDLALRGGYAGSGAPGARSSDATLTVLRQTVGGRRVLELSSAGGVLDGLTLEGGTIASHGAGLYLDGVSTLFTNCVIRDNLMAHSSTHGGGVYITGGTPVFDHCTVEENASGTYGSGGGLYAQNADVTLRHCIIRGNLAKQGGRGGLRFSGGGDSRLFNCLVVHNVSHTASIASGIGVDSSHTLSIENCTVTGNNRIGIEGGSSLSLSNSVVWNHDIDIAGLATGRVFYSSVQDTALTGPGVIHADPLFEFGYYLGGGSGCINAGGATAAALGLDGLYAQASGVDGGIVDLGYHADSGHTLTVSNLYVDAVLGNDGNAGTAPGAGNALKTLTNAIARARMGATIHVAAGTYDSANGEVFPLLLDESKEAVSITGADAETTIIDAGNAARVMQIDHVTDQTRLQQVTLQGGKAGNPYGGAGLLLRWTYAQVTNCVIRSNRTDPRSASGGGGVTVYLGRPTLAKCAIYGNSQAAAAQDGAGGVYLSFSSAVLQSCVVSNNAGTRDAGGLKGTTPVAWRMANCLVADNRNDAGYKWAGVRATTVHIRNSTFANNGTAAEDYAVGAGAASTIANSVFWGNQNDLTDAIATATGQVTYCCIEDGNFAGVDSNISADPLFVAGPRSGYYLSQVAAGEGSDSPCLDAGGDTAENLGLDLLTTRSDETWDAGVVDMGYHYPSDWTRPSGTVFVIR